jgi:starch synthase
MGLDGLLRVRRSALSGIANGIDIEVWNPAADTSLPATFATGSLARRKTNKRTVEARFGLDRDDGPLFCVVSRLTWQKGMDLLGECIDSLVGAGGRLAVLGSGDAALEGILWSASARHPRRVGVHVGYDETLAHLLQGGSDAILIPSRFEPCGLTQFYGLRYGCVPIVSRVGGLADTIVDANDAALAAGVATGIQFLPVETAAFARTILRAVDLFRDRTLWSSMQKRGMKSDVSWSRSAARYADLYRRLTAGTA